MTRQSLAIFAALSLAGCGDKREMASDAVSAATFASAPPRIAAERGPTEQAAAAMPPAQAPIDQKLIRSADLNIEVEDVAAALRSIEGSTKTFGGFVADAANHGDPRGRREGQVQIKVPAPRFDDLIVVLRGLGTVTTENISAEDVTKQYTDLTIRLGVKEETAKRLRALLAERTAKLTDVLEVERELARVVGEIEQMKGERRYLDERVTMATITLHVSEPKPIVNRTADPIRRAFGDSFAVLASSFSTLVYLISFALPWLALAASIWVLTRRFRARWGFPTAKPPSAST